MLNYTGMARSSIEREMDRYSSWPGQATSYTVGKLKVLELRKNAGAQLCKYMIIQNAGVQLCTYMVLQNAGAQLCTYMIIQNAGAQLCKYMIVQYHARQGEHIPARA